MKQAKQIFRDALLLTGAALLMRTVGVWFQIAISNRAGAEAMGLFSLMSGVYGFALTLATSGIHLGVTRMVTETVSRGREERVPGLLRRAVLFSLFFGCLAAILLASSAGIISRYWIKDDRVLLSLRLFAITLPLLSLSSVFGGYFTAVRRSSKSAVGQVCEQALRIGFCMYLLAFFAGNKTERILVALVLGGALAETLSFLLELILYLIDRRKNFPTKKGISAAAEGRELVRITLPVALTTYARSGLITLEHVLIPEGLRNSGATHAAALAAYGSIQSMALPIILYPAALIASFSGLLIPALAECRVLKSHVRIRYMISRVWHFSLLFSIGVAGILICFSTELGEVLYPGTDTARYLRLLAPLIPIMYVDTATDAMLKGLGEQFRSMIINIADAALSVVLVWILVPKFGITGYLVTIYISELFNTVLSIHRLLVVSKTTPKIFKWVYLPLLSVIGASFAAKGLLSLLPNPGNGKLAVCLHILLAAGFYLLFVTLSGSVGKEERAWIRTLFRKKDSDQEIVRETTDGTAIPQAPPAASSRAG
ncbi:MAG: hypothetical protein E7680_02555 [Ruminococcaceae bacterium]|nr:hypothetical protein [Oscillospiraceae bacterium]